MADVFRANPYWRGKVTSSRGSEAQANRASSLRVRDLSVLARRGACVSRSLYRLILWRIRSFPGFELTRCAAPNRPRLQLRWVYRKSGDLRRTADVRRLYGYIP